MKRVGIYIKPEDDRAYNLAGELSEWLHRRECEVYADEQLSGQVGCTCLPLEEMAHKVELIIVLGGDGTLLHVGRSCIGLDTPILGINLGRLGFLTDTPVGSMFDVVSEVLAGNIKTKHHFGLRADIWRGDEHLNHGMAMNDVVLQRNDHPRMIEFEMLIRDQFVFRMRADGLVLATPAGSTAYALSAGGPIVHPQVEAISVVPLCPHILSNRPVVIPADDVIELRLIDSPKPAALNLDGQVHTVLEAGDRVVVAKAGLITLVYLPERHYFKTLRSKLHWAGHDSDEG